MIEKLKAFAYLQRDRFELVRSHLNPCEDFAISY